MDSVYFKQPLENLVNFQEKFYFYNSFNLCNDVHVNFISPNLKNIFSYRPTTSPCGLITINGKTFF